jgi:hypothetical protein
VSNGDEALLESLMIQAWAIYRGGGDRDLGASVAAQIYEVADRLPAPVVQAALVRYGFVDPQMTSLNGMLTNDRVKAKKWP